MIHLFSSLTLSVPILVVMLSLLLMLWWDSLMK